MNHSSIIKAPNLKDESVLCLQKTGSLAKNLFWGFLLLASCRKNTLFGPISLVEFMKIAKDKTFYFDRYKIEFWLQKGDSQRAYGVLSVCQITQELDWKSVAPYLMESKFEIFG